MPTNCGAVDSLVASTGTTFVTPPRRTFSKARYDLDDEDDAQKHLKATEDILQHTLQCLWSIKPEKHYHVDDKAFANPVKNS